MRWLMFILALVFGLVLDLGSKAWAFAVLPDEGNGRVIIDGWLSWTLAVNEGAAFGLFKGQHEFFMLVSLFAFTALPFFVHVLPKRAFGTAGLLGLVLAGVCGNFWDRMVFGHVRDFIDVHTPESGAAYDFFMNAFGTHIWPTFNVADVFITAGLLTAVYLLGKHDDARKLAEAKAKEAAEAAEAEAAEPAKAPAAQTGLEAVEKAPPGFVPIEEVEDEMPPDVDDDSGEGEVEDDAAAAASTGGWALRGGECPFCTLGVSTKGEDWLACAACGHAHHDFCWHEEGQCAECGHASSLDPRGVAAKQAASGAGAVAGADDDRAAQRAEVEAAEATTKAEAQARAQAAKAEADAAAARAKAEADEAEAKARAARAKAEAAKAEAAKAEAAKAEAAKAEAAKAEAAKAEAADDADDADDDAEGALPECPFCEMPVEIVKGDDWLACASCQAPHHDVCWHEEGVCSSCGHDESLSARSVRSG